MNNPAVTWQSAPRPLPSLKGAWSGSSVTGVSPLPVGILTPAAFPIITTNHGNRVVLAPAWPSLPPLPVVAPPARHEFKTLLLIKTAFGLAETALNRYFCKSPMTQALLAEAVASTVESVMTTKIHRHLQAKPPERWGEQPQAYSLPVISALVKLPVAVGLITLNRMAGKEGHQLGAKGWAMALGGNLALGALEGVLADRLTRPTKKPISQAPMAVSA